MRSQLFRHFRGIQTATRLNRRPQFQLSTLLKRTLATERSPHFHSLKKTSEDLKAIHEIVSFTAKEIIRPQISQLASKKDLKNLEKSLKESTTRDLEKFATKQDLKNLEKSLKESTKQDLENLKESTKQDLKLLQSQLIAEFHKNNEQFLRWMIGGSGIIGLLGFGLLLERQGFFKPIAPATHSADAPATLNQNENHTKTPNK